MRESFLDRLISRLDKLDPNNIQACILHLAQEKGFLETVFNSIKEGIVVIDKHLRVQYANKAAVDMLGFPDNMHEQRISRFLRDIDWKLILHEDENEWYKLSRRDVIVYYPRRRILSFYIVPHKAEDGTATIILNDVTESRLSELKNIESEKVNLMSMLAAGVAHEIGNPLNSLNIHLQLLERHFKDAPDEEAEELVDIAKSEVKRLDLIITQFLGAIRPFKPKMERLNLRDLINETLKFMHNELESRSIKSKCDWPEFVPDVTGDVNQLKQAVYNLVRNAAQAMPEGGMIGIKCKVDDDYVHLAISDTGIGISAEDMNNIFDPYFTNKESGTGLGLMIVERIVREHGAELQMKSEPGKGTIFTIVFPREQRRIRLLTAPDSKDYESKK